MNIDDIVFSRGFKKSRKIELLEKFHGENLEKIKLFADKEDVIISCFRDKIFEQPICQLDGCNNKVNYSKNHKFSKGCCVQHSQEITFLEKYGTTNPMKTESVKEKLKHTNMEKFGVENYATTEEFSQYMEINNPMYDEKNKEKLKRTNLERYGVDNPMKDFKIAMKVSKTHKEIFGTYQEGVKKTNLEKYGVENPLQNKDIHKKTVLTQRYNNYYDRILKFPNISPLFSMEEYHGSDNYQWRCDSCGNEFSFVIEDGHVPICRKCHPFEKNLFSKGEKEIVEWLLTIGIVTEENNRTLLNGKEIDILIPNKLAIEFNGVYWHTELKGKDKNYHLDKLNQCQEKGIRLIHIMDRDWNNNRELVKSILMTTLGKIENVIYARKCEVREVANADKKKFLTYNHLQGNDNSKIKLGLYYQNELVSLMTFSKPRYNKNYEWEIHRFANKAFCSVVGSAGKLFEYFVKHYHPNSIVSYSEKNWFTGNVYSSIGMTRLDSTPPNASYIKGSSELLGRINFQKHKLETLLENYNPELTAWENLQLNGYDRIWDCGNHKFEWIRPESS